MNLIIFATFCSLTTAAYWGDPSPDCCSGETYSTGVGIRQYSAALLGLLPGESWEGVCTRLPNTINGQSFARPVRCKNIGPGYNIVGIFNLVDSTCNVDHNWIYEKIGKAIGKDFTCDLSKSSSDGCSVDTFDTPSKAAKNTLNGACVVQDYCYELPKDLGSSKSICDKLATEIAVQRCTDAVDDSTCSNYLSTWFSVPNAAYDSAQRVKPKCSLTATQRASALYAGTQMNVWSTRYSQNGLYILVLQDDGNVVVYRDADRHPVWSSNTSGAYITKALMQYDGNLVLYDAYNVPKWSSGTYNGIEKFALLQNDGNFVIYSTSSPTSWFSTKTTSVAFSVPASYLRSTEVDHTISIAKIADMTILSAPLAASSTGTIEYFDKDPIAAPRQGTRAGPLN